jgi:hypothetical protein
MAVALVRWQSHSCDGSRACAMAVELVRWQSSSCDGSQVHAMAVELLCDCSRALVRWQSSSYAMAVQLLCNGSRACVMAVELVQWQSSSCDGSRAHAMAVELVQWQSSSCDGSQAIMMAELVKELSSIFLYYISLSIQNLLGTSSTFFKKIYMYRTLSNFDP